MPSTVSGLCSFVGLNPQGPVQWGKPVRCEQKGVYFVCRSNEAIASQGLGACPVAPSRIECWLKKVPGLTLDGHRPSVLELSKRISAFWLPDETILYIAQTERILDKRLNELYQHVLGCRAPHRGGHWLKVLANLADLNIFWSPTEQPKKLENRLLALFSAAVSPTSRAVLFDPNLPLPFANLQLQNGNRKRHGIKNSVIQC